MKPRGRRPHLSNAYHNEATILPRCSTACRPDRPFSHYMISKMATTPTTPFSCFCLFTAGLLLLPAASLHAATALSGGAKKAPAQKSITRAVSKTPVKVQPVKKAQVVRLHAESKTQTASHKAKPERKTGKSKGQQERKVAQQATAGNRAADLAQKATAAKTRRVHSASAQLTTHTPQNNDRLDAAGDTVQTGDTPFLKRKATLNACTRLARTLQDQLGVEVLVQEDPRHSGGLFIAPPSTETDRESAAKAMDLLANLPLGKPIEASISSPFGGRQDPINGRKAFHEGVDFQAKTGEKVQATGKGRVVSSSYSPDYGENVIVSHGRGYETMYAHLSKRLVQVGDSITPGDTVGLVGNTGRSTGSHLHYEIRHQGAPINPMDYMLATQQAQLQKK